MIWHVSLVIKMDFVLNYNYPSFVVLCLLGEPILIYGFYPISNKINGQTDQKHFTDLKDCFGCEQIRFCLVRINCVRKCDLLMLNFLVCETTRWYLPKYCYGSDHSIIEYRNKAQRNF